MDNVMLLVLVPPTVYLFPAHISRDVIATIREHARQIVILEVPALLVLAILVIMLFVGAFLIPAFVIVFQIDRMWSQGD
jgi:hypothetical protein